MEQSTAFKTSFGVSGDAWNWIRTYLIGRFQMVAIGSCRSPGASCRFCVPQGSVLGPLFFILYIAPIVKIVSSHGISHRHFADDTQLFISVSPDDVANNLANLGDCIQTLFTWFCCSNGLCFNTTKSECLLVGTAQRLKTMPDIANVSVAALAVQFSSSITALGTHLDIGLTFDCHV